VTIGLAHRAKAGIRRVGRADYQAGGNRSYSGIDLASRPHLRDNTPG